MGDSVRADTGGGNNAGDVKLDTFNAIVISEEHQQSGAGTKQDKVLMSDAAAGLLLSEDDDEMARKRPRKHGIKRQCKVCGELGHYQKTCQSRPRGAAAQNVPLASMMHMQAAAASMMSPTAAAAAAAAEQHAHNAPHPLQHMIHKRMTDDEDILLPHSDADTGKVPLLNSTAQAASVPQWVRLDPQEHVPFTISEGPVGECVVCYKRHMTSEGKAPQPPAGRTCLKCIRCGVFLCSTLENPCWKDFHTNPVLFSE